jgi:hypothetical protein
MRFAVGCGAYRLDDNARRVDLFGMCLREFGFLASGKALLG